MSLSLPPRQMHHTDQEHEAYQAGYESGWTHANYVEAYGYEPDDEPSSRYQQHLAEWRSGYDEGVYQFTMQSEDDDDDDDDDESFDERR
jgi:hypothetical protein